eukprot:4794287-Pleurochrysis_carterae.AAC.1
MIARRWLKDNGYFWSYHRLLHNQFMHHFLSSCRQPAGRADGTRGSQQCAFEMELTHPACVQHLDLYPNVHIQRKLNQKYTIDEAGQI